MAHDFDRRGEPHLADAHCAASGPRCAARPEPGISGSASFPHALLTTRVRKLFLISHAHRMDEMTGRCVGLQWCCVCRVRRLAGACVGGGRDSAGAHPCGADVNHGRVRNGGSGWCRRVRDRWRYLFLSHPAARILLPSCMRTDMREGLS